jgi:adenylate cyclase
MTPPGAPPFTLAAPAGIDALFDWLVDGAPGAASAQEVVQRLGDALAEAGVPLDRMLVFVTTLHPSILGRSFSWTLGQRVTVTDQTQAMQQSPAFQASPLAQVSGARRELRRRLSGGLEVDDYVALSEPASAGFTDYLCLPMCFVSGETHAISFATRAPTGFSPEHLAAMRALVRPLARLAEILALRRTAINLLSTYVGHNAGERILAGRVFRGDIESLRAVIWSSDLRGFTDLSARTPPQKVIQLLNELFDCQVPYIERQGGEVLKFMGDGLLAIFPFSDEGAAGPRCDAGLRAAADALAALDRRNAHSSPPMQVGIALHVGEIQYGNIGGSGRLDFTAIGSAVNLATRIEGLTARVGRRLLVSADFAAQASGAMEPVGEFELKGVGAPQRVFAPLPGPPGAG